MPALKDVFIELVRKYTDNIQIITESWTDIETYYTNPNRYYHNLSHLKNIYEHLVVCKATINDYETVLFSMFYHDIIYNPKRKDNEEKSAEFAVKSLKKIQCPEHKINRCKEQILATKHHKLNDNNDINIFTDADIAILGQSREMYLQYTKQIRKEYAFYPDFMYNKGRRKVLEHFLNLERIYKTNWFYNKYEEQARRNVELELW